MTHTQNGARVSRDGQSVYANMLKEISKSIAQTNCAFLIVDRDLLSN